MNKTGVPKEAQDDALSNGTTGGHQTSTGRPTRGNVVRMTVFFVFVWLWSELEALNFPFLATLIFWRENIVGDGPLSPFLARALRITRNCLAGLVPLVCT